MIRCNTHFVVKNRVICCVFVMWYQKDRRPLRSSQQFQAARVSVLPWNGWHHDGDFTRKLHYKSTQISQCLNTAALRTSDQRIPHEWQHSQVTSPDCFNAIECCHLRNLNSSADSAIHACNLWRTEALTQPFFSGATNLFTCSRWKQKKNAETIRSL